jgi:hypothetical protein
MPRERDRRPATERIKELTIADDAFLPTLGEIYAHKKNTWPPSAVSPYQTLTEKECLLRDSINASREKRGY